MLGDLLRPEIEELIATRNFTVLRESLAGLPTEDVAEIFSEMPADQVAVAFRILPRDLAADVLEHLPIEQQEEVLKSLGQEQVAAVLNEMDADDRTALLEEMPGAAAQKLISLLKPEERRIAVTLLGYPEESIGRLMTPDYVTIKQDWTVSDVLDHLRRVGRDKETLNIVFVVDGQGHLLDDIRLRDIVIADPNTQVADLMDGHFPSLRVNDDQEVAIGEFKKYDRSVLPVIDSKDTLVGIVTVDDVLDVAEQEETEDVQKMAAVATLEAPYLDVGLVEIVKKRVGWLFILFIGEMFTATVVGHFEDEIAEAVFLAVFIPLIISSGGNAGSQAASLVIRAMAIGEVTLRDWWRVFRRELATGLMLGTTLGIIAFGRVFLLPPKLENKDGLILVAEEHHLKVIALIAAAVAVSVLGVVLWGALAGAMLPFLLKRLKFDPASSSTPFVATLVDVTGLMIYFVTAKFLLQGLLL